MSDTEGPSELSADVAAFGADFSKWPPARVAGAREELLRDPEFRQAWERERELDRAIATARGELDDAIGRSGAVGRVRRAALARLPRSPLGRIGLGRIAAAMLVAGILGGAMDLILAGQEGETADVAVVDPVLYGLEPIEIQ
jgi:hypothetical protein